MSRTPQAARDDLTRTLVGDGWLKEARQNIRAAMRRRWMHLPVPALPPSSPPAVWAPPRPAPEDPPAPTPHRAPALPARRATREVLWWDDPIAIGGLLVLLPPAGLLALWASRRYSRDARWAVTGMMALMMCLGTALVVTLAR